jgi:hypothetical protein
MILFITHRILDAGDDRKEKGGKRGSVKCGK